MKSTSLPISNIGITLFIVCLAAGAFGSAGLRHPAVRLYVLRQFPL